MTAGRVLLRTAQALHTQSIRPICRAVRRVHAARLVANSPLAEVPARLWERLAAAAGIERKTRWADLTRDAARRLAVQISATRLPVTGKSVNKDEFVTCGGVRLAEVDFRTMASRVCPGLHLAGELLDVDGGLPVPVLGRPVERHAEHEALDADEQLRQFLQDDDNLFLLALGGTTLEHADRHSRNCLTTPRIDYGHTNAAHTLTSFLAVQSKALGANFLQLLQQSIDAAAASCRQFRQWLVTKKPPDLVVAEGADQCLASGRATCRQAHADSIGEPDRQSSVATGDINNIGSIAHGQYRAFFVKKLQGVECLPELPCDIGTRQIGMRQIDNMGTEVVGAIILALEQSGQGQAVTKAVRRTFWQFKPRTKLT